MESAEWLFPQEEATLAGLEMSRSEAKPRYGIS
jgi:hypothetical protein